jgi:hypothetical protein
LQTIKLAYVGCATRTLRLIKKPGFLPTGFLGGAILKPGFLPTGFLGGAKTIDTETRFFTNRVSGGSDTETRFFKYPCKINYIPNRQDACSTGKFLWKYFCIPTYQPGFWGERY